MKRRDPELGKGWVQIVHTPAVETGGGPQRMLRANIEGSCCINVQLESGAFRPKVVEENQNATNA